MALGNARRLSELERFHELVASLEAVFWEADAGSLRLSFVGGRAEQLLGANEQEVEHWLTYADAFLRAKLGDLRLTPQAFAADADYILAGAPSPATLLTQEFDQLTRNKAPT